ncbi:hypothetical protein OU798_04860 [Prolixibacteraceae bacterium Z1-6]|uniref:Uncharacterized protein n=1 Tax=Draconibacterium aestuarii TaxID=2998507 RepID=A0A9X3F327_9BACT|nr:hypothetical protein [Prolixibacteraceae bacterium Z1-6]
MKAKNLFNLIITIVFISFISCTQKQPPTDSENRPLIVKKGTIDTDLVEATPIVFNKKVYRFEYVRPHYWKNNTGDSYSRFIDHETGLATPAFAKGYHLGSAFVDNNTVYVSVVNIWDGEEVHIFASDDLEHWSHWLAFKLSGYGIFNTSMTKAEDKFVLMFEIGKPESEAGKRFTARFATSDNLKNWTVLPPEYNYAKDRYTAPHCLRYMDGYYYDFFLEAHEGYEMRVVRSKNLKDWDLSPLNPVLKASEEDKMIANEKLPAKQRQRIEVAENRNNSDIDFCEYKGKLIINYSWGNQRGEEFLAEAYYEGTLKQFLKGWFPE